MSLRRLITTTHLFLDLDTGLVCVRAKGQSNEVLGMLWDQDGFRYQRRHGMPKSIGNEWIDLMMWELEHVDVLECP